MSYYHYQKSSVTWGPTEFIFRGTGDTFDVKAGHLRVPKQLEQSRVALFQVHLGVSLPSLEFGGRNARLAFGSFDRIEDELELLRLVLKRRCCRRCC